MRIRTQRDQYAGCVCTTCSWSWLQHASADICGHKPQSERILLASSYEAAQVSSWPMANKYHTHAMMWLMANSNKTWGQEMATPAASQNPCASMRLNWACLTSMMWQHGPLHDCCQCFHCEIRQSALSFWSTVHQSFLYHLPPRWSWLQHLTFWCVFPAARGPSSQSSSQQAKHHGDAILIGKWWTRVNLTKTRSGDLRKKEWLTLLHLSWPFLRLS